MNTMIGPIRSINWHTVQSGVIFLMAVIILALLFTFIPQMQMEMPPSIAGYQFFRVVGHSMEPTFSNGSILVTRQTLPENIQPSDIITYQCTRSQVALTTHRVKKVIWNADGSLQFITRGDNNPVTDPIPVCDCDVVGKVVWVITTPVNAVTVATTHLLNNLQIFIAGAFLLLTWLRKQQQDHHEDQQLFR
ncbi:MAG: signal peptidase I [Bacillota bacterium]|nr:signal peptidase I [Bacillota bacterium]MDW7676274.1 signal peptidase I [Bacillota bacterium]